jgi:AbrB family looped-hinge helix DNA binding protein
MGKTQAEVWEILEIEMNKRGIITIPSDIREKYNIAHGDKITIGLLQVEGETQQDRNWKNRDRINSMKFDKFLRQEKIKHDDKGKAYMMARKRLEEEHHTHERDLENTELKEDLEKYE